MYFWVFLLISILTIPLSMILFGIIFTNKTPSKVNYLYGYRTKRSMINQNTWRFAHQYIGKLWHYLGLGNLILTSIIIFLIKDKTDHELESLSLVIVGIQLIVIIFPIILTEKALKRTFDDKGNYK